MVVCSAGTEWREELVQALELVAVVMKDKLASLPRPRVSPQMLGGVQEQVACTMVYVAEDFPGKNGS